MVQYYLKIKWVLFYQISNRSDEEIEKANKQCDKCEKTIFLPHYHAHQLKHIKEEAVEQEPVVEKRSTSPGPDGKRSAACRAASKITNITKVSACCMVESDIRRIAGRTSQVRHFSSSLIKCSTFVSIKVYLFNNTFMFTGCPRIFAIDFSQPAL
jgi:hypothetical protein